MGKAQDPFHSLMSKALPSVIVAAALFLTANAQAQTQITTTAIHIDKTSVPATDLVDGNGNALPVQTLQDLRSNGTDISKYDPAESQLWTHNRAATQSLDISETDQVRFDSLSTSRLGNFRFNGYVQTSTGQQAFQFNLSRTVHDILMRDALLRKLGYRLDPIKYLKRVRVNFNSALEAEDFILQLRTKTAGSKERFVVEGDEKSGYLILQDVVAVPAQFENYSLAYGTIPSSIIAGRRVLNSLIVPLSLVQMPESVNLFSWDNGSVFQNSILLDSESSDGVGNSTFTTSYEDALWAARQLMKLTRKDFTEIVQFAQLPKEVALLTVEKLIARRNSMAKIFKLKTEELAINANVSSGSRLKNGKITKVYEDNWPGYSARFAFGDPESPISSTQMLLLGRAELNSLVLQNLVGQFNSRVLKGTDVNKKLTQKINERINRDLISLITTGHTQSSTYAIDGVPYGQYNFILSRDIVSGSYLGSDNVVSAVDSIGVSLNVGGFFAVSGLPANVNATINASASVTRTYSHLTPVRSLELALKQPFKNLIVPKVQHELANVLEALNNLTAQKLATDEGKKTFDDAISKLKDNLAVGESFIITDSVGPALAMTLGYGMVTPVGIDLTAYGAFTAQQYVLGRTHLLRSDENTIQVYRDVGQSLDLGLSFNVKLQATVLTLGVDHLSGTAKTKYFSVPLAANPEEPKTLAQVQALVQTIRSGSLESLQDVQKPYVLTGDLTANSATASLLFYRWKWQNRSDLISITAPTGQTRDFQKRVRGTRSGNNYQDFALDVATSLIRTGLNQDVTLSRTGGSDPADSFGGSSKSRIIDYEAQIDNYDEKKESGQAEDEVVKLSYRWRGWAADQKSLQKIVDQVNAKAGADLLSKLALKDTKKLRLYNIELSLLVYEKGLEQLQRNIGKVRDELARLKVPPHQIDAIARHIQLLKNHQKDKKFDSYSKEAIEAINNLEQFIPIPKLLPLIGKQNMFVYARLGGFREGDEAGDHEMLSNSLGEVGSAHRLGPATALKDKIGISTSELFSNWLLEAL